MAILIIGLLLLAMYALLIFYYKHCWDRLPEFEPNDDNRKVKVSVIIPARNEAENIQSLLSALSKQSYPNEYLEIIIVDDFSTDATVEKIDASNLKNISLVQLSGEHSLSSKKKAIHAGIEKATGELIITTDADSLPPANWIKTIANFYFEKKGVFIAAPVAYFSNGSFLHIFQTLDFTMLQGITAASVAGNFHSMCNGANLAYKRSAFFEVDGFSGIDKVASGDDILLMYKIWKQYPGQVHYLKNREAIVSTQPVPTWKDFFLQRIRWASKTMYYNDKRIFLALLLVYMTNLYFLSLLIAGIWNSIYWLAALLFILIKTFIEIPFFYSVAKFYDQQKLSRYFLLFQPMHILYIVVIGLLSQFGKYEWKGRKTK